MRSHSARIAVDNQNIRRVIVVIDDTRCEVQLVAVVDFDFGRQQCVVGWIDVEDQLVDPATTVKLVAAVLAFQLIRIGAAPDFVVTTTTVELVFTSLAQQHISSTVDVRLERDVL